MGYLYASVAPSTCVSSTEVAVTPSDEEYWYIMSCGKSSSLADVDVYTVFYQNEACAGLPSFEYAYDYLAQCNCDDLGFYNETKMLDTSPPSPPLPPLPPQAPPLIIVNGSELVIDNDDFAADQLEDVMGMPEIHLVTLRVDVVLRDRLPILNHTLTVIGDCNSTDLSMGAHCTIDGSQPRMIFRVGVAGALTLERLVLTNRRQSFDSRETYPMEDFSGGAVAVWGDRHARSRPFAELYDCELVGNSVTGDGGAAYVEEGSLTFVACRLENNTAGRGGGSVAARFADVVMRNSTVAGSAGRTGGGVHVASSNLTVAGSLLEGNAAMLLGGGLYSDASAVTLEGGTRVAQNRALYDQYSSESSGLGGGLYIAGGRSSRRRALPGGQSEGSALGSGLELNAASVTGNHADEAGGGIFMDESELVIRNRSMISSNLANLGGGIYGNHATSISISGESMVTSNEAGEGGGLVVGPIRGQQAGTSVQVVDSRVTRNAATGGSGNGGCILTGLGCTLVLQQATIANCSASGDGGGVYMGSGSALVLTNGSTVRTCTADGNGGGIFGADSSDVSVEKGSLVDSNQAVGNGGGIHTSGALLVKSSTVSHNQAHGGGGLFANVDASISLEDGSAVGANSALDSGGGIACVSNTWISLRRSHVASNHGNLGGGINAMGNNITVTLDEQSTLSYNLGQTEGGGLRAEGWREGSVSVKVFGSSTVLGNEVARYHGGGLALQVGADLNLAGNSTMDGNYAAISGGGLYVNGGKVAASNATFLDNRADHMGGHVYATTHSQMQLVRCLLRGGEAAVAGGALSISESSVVLVNASLLANNMAMQNGAGVDLRDRSHLVIADSVLTGHVVNTGKGGAVYLDNSSAQIMSSVVEGNTASDGGAGLATMGGALHVHACNMIGNHASHGSGGGILLGPTSKATITNSSCYNNSAGSDGGAVATETETAGLALREMRLEGNAAQRGTVYIAAPGKLLEGAWLERLHFADNNRDSLHGHNVFYTYEPQISLPECFNCTFPENTLLHATSPTSYVLSQGANIISLISFSENYTENLTAVITADSWDNVEPAIRYELWDYFGAVCEPPSPASIHAALYPKFDSDSDLDSNYVVLAGSTTALYTKEGATFDSLVLAGSLGVPHTVYFSATEPTWAVLSVHVELHACQPGDYYDSEVQACLTCEEGTLKFTNDSSPCTSCLDSGLICPGGNRFTLEDGYWIANGAIAVACDTSDVHCLLDRVDLCDDVDACNASDTGVARSNVNGSMEVPEHLLCAEGYDSAAVQCSACEMGYEMTSSQECEKCPLKWVAWVQMIGLFSITPLAVYAITHVLRVIARMPKLQSMEMTRKAVRAKTLIEVLIGHLQVLIQFSSIFDFNMMPKVVQEFLRMFLFLDPNIGWSGLVCVLYHTTGTDSGYSKFGHFYVSFWIYVILILLISAPIFVYTFPQSYIVVFFRRSFQWVILGLQTAKSAVRDCVWGTGENANTAKEDSVAPSTRRSTTMQGTLLPPDVEQVGDVEQVRASTTHMRFNLNPACVQKSASGWPERTVRLQAQIRAKFADNDMPKPAEVELQRVLNALQPVADQPVRSHEESGSLTLSIGCGFVVLEVASSISHTAEALHEALHKAQHKALLQPSELAAETNRAW
ncbi:hypothetical protein CYMTET_28440 [Cymbomonas tetramitiformis]|uniref:Right handed beta helix domain-containing protein n=1 Tax=Cymbomonas tetramitiformis TaxID=36881 RepID=A0AAE0FN35_9CHLO|nr:hypothetical protein CYMTET_28440 [Cymbomonas tetramitiformis]